MLDEELEFIELIDDALEFKELGVLKDVILELEKDDNEDPVERVEEDLEDRETDEVDEKRTVLDEELIDDKELLELLEEL